jgi:hypothetical protein
MEPRPERHHQRRQRRPDRLAELGRRQCAPNPAGTYVGVGLPVDSTVVPPCP